MAGCGKEQQAELRRSHNRSTYGSIVLKYKLTDRGVLEIGRIIHDIEINTWGRKVRAESEELEQRIREIIKSSEDPAESFSRSFTIFDELYKKLAGKVPGQ